MRYLLLPQVVTKVTITKSGWFWLQVEEEPPRRRGREGWVFIYQSCSMNKSLSSQSRLGRDQGQSWSWWACTADYRHRDTSISVGSTSGFQIPRLDKWLGLTQSDLHLGNRIPWHRNPTIPENGQFCSVSLHDTRGVSDTSLLQVKSLTLELMVV